MSGCVLGDVLGVSRCIGMIYKGPDEFHGCHFGHVVNRHNTKEMFISVLLTFS